MQTDTSSVSRIGDRSDNQDRVLVKRLDGAVLLVVADGMGGHADGAMAAQAAIDAFEREFPRRGGDPNAFLSTAMQRAHDAVVALGEGVSLDVRPRTTCVAALVVKRQVWWAHVGDSRAYWLHEGDAGARTRDHSHVEALIESGEITEADARHHPLRNLVDRCIGGEPEPVEVDCAGPFSLSPGDVVLLCSDGFWDGINLPAAVRLLHESPSLEGALEALADAACGANAPFADNSTAAALRMRT